MNLAVNIEQAIFTSLCSQRQKGYQLAASSPGLTAGEVQELSVWGPAHDALMCDAGRPLSINFHRLSSGRFAVSRTHLNGDEYSGRGGGQVYSHILVLRERVFASFGYHPFRVLEAAEVAGRLTLWEPGTETLESFPLPGACSPVRGIEVARAKQTLSTSLLSRLLHITMLPENVGVMTDRNPHLQVAAMFDLLPLDRRTDMTFSTGLKPSQQRNFHLQIAHTTNDANEVQRLDRQRVWFDLRHDAGDLVGPLNEWAEFVAALLEGGHIAALPRVLRSTDRQRDGSLSGILSELQLGLQQNIGWPAASAEVPI